MAKLLDGLTVLDFTRVLAGPFCTMILSDLGARVIKVEPPGGDEARHIGPMVNESSVYFASINRGKEGIALNLKHRAGLELARRLVRTADVLTENFRPGTLERIGLGYQHVSNINPGIIYASLSGFGQTGPYSERGAYDIIIQAMSGMMSITGQPGRPPTRVGASIGDTIPALYTAIAILAGLHQRSANGRGVRIDIGMMDAAFAVVENALARYWATDEDPAPIGNRHPAITPFSAFTTADGTIVIGAGNDALWRKLCVTIGRPDLADDDSLGNNEMRNANIERLSAELNKTLSSRSTEHWLKLLLEAKVPCGRVNSMSDLAGDPHLAREKK
jgi:CoA:oxalate CoA-transferase